MKNGIKWKAVIRDVVIVWIFIGLAVLVVGVVEPDGRILVTLAVPVAIILGFTNSGCMTKINRWKHLYFVAFGVWLVMGVLWCLIPRITDGDYVGTIDWFVSFTLILFLSSLFSVLCTSLGIVAAIFIFQWLEKKCIRNKPK
jgi:hypothetical protein